MIPPSVPCRSSPSTSDERKDDKVEIEHRVPDVNFQANNTKSSSMPTTNESIKQEHIDPATPPSLPIPPPPTIITTTTPPSHVADTHAPDASPEVLAREERRRRRDERRAARALNPTPETSYRSPLEYLEDRCKLDVHTYHPVDKKKKCLVLDIDYTIFDHKSDFDLALEFKRPYLHEFLKICSAYYNIVIWSATAFYHIQTKMEKLQLFNHPDFQICFVLSKDHMIPHGFSIKRKTYFQDIKPLSLLWMKYPEVFNADNTIHIDDVEENFVLNPSNGLRIDPFREALLFRQTDRELFYLAQYLTMIADTPSFSNLNHNKWKDYIINTLWGLQTVLSLPTFTPPDPPTSHLLEHHHQSLVIKQKIKEKAKEQERDERMQRHMEEERRKALALADAVVALSEVDNNNINNINNGNNTATCNTNIINNNTNNKKEATEDELIKLAREAMEGPPLRSPKTSPPRSPFKSSSSSSSSPSPSFSSSFASSTRTPPKSPTRSPLTPFSSSSSSTLSPSSSSSSTPPKSPNRSKNANQFLTIPSLNNFSNSPPLLSLSNPSPPVNRRERDIIREKNDNRGTREMIIKERERERECILNQLDDWSSSSPSSPSPSSSSFNTLSLPLSQISPIAHAAN